MYDTIPLIIYINIIKVTISILTRDTHPRSVPDPIDLSIQQIHIDLTLSKLIAASSIYFLINLYM
jgi:hypothetical protein